MTLSSGSPDGAPTTGTIEISALCSSHLKDMRKANISKVEMQEECVEARVIFTSCCWTLSCIHIVAQVVYSHLKMTINISRVPRITMLSCECKSYRMVPQTCILYMARVSRDPKLYKS